MLTILKKLKHVFINTLVIACAFVLLPAFAVQTNAAQSPNYAVVIDAGSSGSRAYVYQYDSRAQKISQLQIKLLGLKKIKPGLASFRKNPDKAKKYIKPLINYAKGLLPTRKKQQQTDFYLLATAGMRFIPNDAQNAIYNHVKRYVKSATEFNVQAVKTIPGSWEGIYDWIAVNYLLDTLAPNKTIGVIDIGGGSAEITYNFSAPSHKIKIGQTQYSLYSRSDLGLGLNQARYQLTNTPACFYKGYHLPNGRSGHGDVEKCINRVQPLINQVHGVAQSTPSAPAGKQFIGISGLAYTAQAPGFKNHHAMKLRQFRQAGQYICSRDWKHFKQQHPRDHHLFGYCFTSSLAYTLLNQGYHIADNKKLQLTNHINKRPIDWALGVVIFNVLGSAGAE